MKEGIDFYYNAEGLMVLTETYHLKRGRCCGNGCLHCPYDYVAVAEPHRSVLRNQRIKYGETKADKKAR